jgi:endonuclease/exonuclease/phosphatase family metal-dependent hydrolase
MRIASLNIQSGMHNTQGYLSQLRLYRYFMPHPRSQSKSISEITAWIKNSGIEVCTFMEIDGGSWRSSSKNQVRELSEESDLKYNEFFPTIKLGKIINQGNGIISKYPIIKTESYRLPGSGEARYLCQATIQGERIFNVYFTHLALRKKDRIRQLRTIDNIVGDSEYPAILLGDLNTGDNNELSILEMQPMPDIKTYPSWNPRKCFDHAYYSKDFEKCRIYTEKLQASDHLPIIIEV